MTPSTNTIRSALAAVLFIVCGLLGASYIFGGDSHASVSDANGLAQRLSKDRDPTVESVYKQRLALIKDLMAIADPANAKNYDEKSRVGAIFLLGRLRAAEAAPMLSKMVGETLGPTYGFGSERYSAPVLSALIEIGRPAVPGLIENIQTSDEEIVRNYSLFVTMHVLGGKKHVSELLDKLDQANKDEAVRKRLAGAKKFMEESYEGYKEPLF